MEICCNIHSNEVYIIKIVEFILTKFMDTEFRIDLYPFLTFEITVVIICANSVPLRNSVFCHSIDLYVSYTRRTNRNYFCLFKT